ncbi:fluoride efflux transporter CrcB [Desulfonatronum thioautotrophicum]|uniref:fluoride efflux transporter CrcB n=1 Tax=Desulfonatronum thioautotrophicum TaxID=617001 RepID=UPI0005EB489A|nr:fluoride efflux transporter CrcB [Desulfonatronum thioautotrophicum]
MYELLLFCLAAALGAMARYGLSAFIYGLLGRNFPWGTAVVNIMGCFLFGLTWMLTDGIEMSAQVRVILLIGFMGSFSTFSTYIFESHLLLQQGKRFYVLLNVFGQTLIGLGALYCGFLLGRLW